MVVKTPTLELEHRLGSQGFRWVIAVDEVGRGALAGPVAVGVTVFPVDNLSSLSAWPTLLRDSKLLSREQRDLVRAELGGWLAEVGAQVGIGWGAASQVDESGIIAALRAAFSEAFEAAVSAAASPLTLGTLASDAVVLLDGSHNWLADLADPIPSDCKVKADQDCVSVAISSVLAKCARDDLMTELSAQHPEYGFEGNAGYASPTHIEALLRVGPSAIHRQSFLSKIIAPYNKANGRE